MRTVMTVDANKSGIDEIEAGVRFAAPYYDIIRVVFFQLQSIVHRREFFRSHFLVEITPDLQVIARNGRTFLFFNNLSGPDNL